MLAIGAVGILALCYGLYVLRNVALIVTLAGFWAYFLAWPAKALSRWMPYKLAIQIVFYTSFLLILGLLGPLGSVLFKQTNQLIGQLPAIALQLEQYTTDLSLELVPGQPIQLDQPIRDALEQLRQNAPNLLKQAFNASQSILSSTAEVLLALIVIPLIALYILMDTDRLRRSILELFPSRMRGDVEQVMSSINRSLGSYIYNRVILSLFASLAMLVVLLSLGVDYAFIFALVAFVSEFIPVIGAWLALAPMLLVAIATQPPWVAIVLFIAFGVIQLVQSYVLTPKMMAETMDMHPLTVVIAMLIGGSVGGFAGLLLAIPVAAALKVIVNVFVFRRGEKGVHLPSLDLIGASNGPGGLEFREAPGPQHAPPVVAAPLPAVAKVKPAADVVPAKPATKPRPKR